MEETKRMLDIIEKQYREAYIEETKKRKKKELEDKLTLIALTALWTFCITIFFII